MKRGWKRAVFALVGVLVFLSALLAVTLRETHRAETGEAYGERPGAQKQVMAQAARQNAAPYTLAEWKRREVKQGADALREIAHLHGKGIGLTDAVVSRYGSGESGATLWIGWAPDAQTAGVLIEKMAAGIRAGSSPFTELETRMTEGHPIHILTGQGRRHAYFADGNRMVWVTADTTAFERVVKDVLDWIHKT